MTKQELLTRVEASDKPLVLVDFYADWCGACQVMMPELKKLVDENPDKLEVVKINVDGDGNRDLARQYNISSIPALFLYQNGRLVEDNTITNGNLVATVLRYF